ncbi:M50 family metallopeptidase [Alloacidobacterium dinghuense]|uniref:M50 family metallopeptidase n=1 Tax=Alloacidobacterium dinghuense TaxID=2763107 RepID=A0A7G8BCR0_9BACT|nr:M50 family metallopeptidase [Alloacidobacterium dinghuense]QNI30330.1 M50 family metallopeptidase [Alloacidobacterium dinghuense]
MRGLRKFLCWCFAVAAFAFIVFPMKARLAHGYWSPGWKFALGAIVPMVLAAVFAMAWWTAFSEKDSARNWGIVASLVYLLLGVSVTAFSPAASKAQPSWLLSGIGVAGLIAFSRRDIAAPEGEKTSSQRSGPGDGTNPILDKLVWIVAVVGFWLAWSYGWERWARMEGLSLHPGLQYLVEVLIASLAVVAVHECGHAVIGMALGMKLHAFFVGPFQWRVREGRWTFQFLPRKIFDLGGATGVVSRSLEHFREYRVCMIAAGPFASLIFGLLAFGAAITAPNSGWESEFSLLAQMATLSLLAFVLNLIPIRSKNSYSDGAQIYQILSDGPWGDYHRAMSIVGSTLVTPLRPKDYDIDAIQRAAAGITHGLQGLLLRLYACSYYLDCGRFAEASQALAEAEAVYQESASDIPAELHAAFVFRVAFLRRDAAGARVWWERMEAKRPTRLNVDYWLARSALCWVENHLIEAHEAWGKCYSLARLLPHTGAYEFERHCIELLRRPLYDSSAHRALGELRSLVG